MNYFQEMFPDLKKTSTLSKNEILSEKFSLFGNNIWETKINSALESYKQRDILKSLEFVNNALSIRESHALSHIIKANVFEDLQRYQDSIEYHKKSLQYCEDEHSRYFQLGFAYSKIEDYQLTIKAYQTALFLKIEELKTSQVYPRLYFGIPFNIDIEKIYSNLANAKINIGDFEGAISDCDEALKYNKLYPNAYFFKGIALGVGNNDKKYGLGKVDLAVKNLQQASTLGFQNATSILFSFFGIRS